MGKMALRRVLVLLLGVGLTGQSCGIDRPHESPDDQVESLTAALVSAALPRTGWVATASSSSAADVPARALDGDGQTRWSSGRPQANGQWFQVDMLTTQSFVQITLDATGSNNDYPRRYQVFVSDDGSTWGSPIASATASSPLVTISFAEQRARFVQIVQTGSASSWWSIHELTVHPLALPLPRAGWVASTSSSHPGEVPARALDGDRRTRWSSGKPQANGQFFQVDMKTRQSFDQIVLDAVNSAKDFPRGYQVFASDDPANWGAPIATGKGTAAVVSISFPIQLARYFKIVQTGHAQNWWSIHELNVYRTKAASDVHPMAECVVSRPDGTFKAVFGYAFTAPPGNTVTIPIGRNNSFDPAPAGRGQPTRFRAGRHTAQFAVPFDGRALAWQLDGTSSTANAMLTECTPACVQHLTDPSKPRIDDVQPPARPLSIEESIAMRDSFRWDDVLPVPETLADGTPRVYQGLVYIDGPGTAQAMDALRIHYDIVPLFESEMQSLEAQGIPVTSYPNDGQGQFAFALIPGAVYNGIRQAALDPVEPLEIFRAVQLRPIPADDLQLETRLSCGLQPVAECVARAGDGSLRAVFGYDNPAGSAVTIPAGTDNGLTGGPSGAAPPEAFATGRHQAVFAVSMAAGGTVAWRLNGTTVSLGAASPLCSAATVNAIGKDRFAPFPPPAPRTCRVASPAEALHPNSSLPPAARVNTCTALSYSFVGQTGFQWRGVASDAEDLKGLAADAALALGATMMASAPLAGATTMSDDGDSIEAVQSALFGKIFRRVVQVVAGAGKGAVDAFRRGARAVTGLFLGETGVTITASALNTDPDLNPGMPPIPTPMLQAWGAGYGNPISLQGVEVRASKSLFLSLARLDANNRAGVRVLNGLGARICFTGANSAAKIVDGWFLPVTICPGGASAQIGGSPPATQTVTIVHNQMNVLAQMTDTQRYMRDVGRFPVDQAEVLVGTIPNLIGKLNSNRAFAPCFGFSWANDVTTFMTALGAVAANHLNEIGVQKVDAAARTALRGLDRGTRALLDAQARIHALAADLAGTALAGTANAAAAAIDVAVAQAQGAVTATTILTQEAGDVVDTVGAAARLATRNDPRVNQATSTARRAVDAANAQAPLARDAIAAAGTAAQQALAPIDLLVQALAPDSPLRIAAAAVHAQVGQVASQLIGLLNVVVTVVLDIERVAATTAGALIGSAIGNTIGQLFEFFAGGDVLLPASDGDSSSLDSRGVPTHEYGHFTYCSLMHSVNPLQFVVAYNEAAVQGLVTQQSPSATSSVMNEAFADLIASQVMGGTNYSQPTTDVERRGGVSYCFAAATGCIEDNVTNPGAMVPPSFIEFVRRNVTLYVDALDGSFVGIRGDLPTNGNAWRLEMDTLRLDPVQGLASGDDRIRLLGPTFRRWVSHTFERGALLRENNVFGGLSDTMIDNGFGWCPRCEVFRLHTIEPMSGLPICPEEFVGPRPTFTHNGMPTTLTCLFDGCPAGTTANAATGVCDPPCPPGQTFNGFLLVCEPIIIVP